MARIARDSTPKRRSARLSNQQPGSTRKPLSNPQLDCVLERDETPDIEQLPIDDVATPATRKSLDERMKALSNITTPKTEPKPANAQMHPATIHQTTAKAPDSGLKLGFADIATTGRASLASLQNTPSRPRQSLAHTNISPSFQFKFSHESNMSEEGRRLMDSIRGDAARIKEQLRGEKEAAAQGENMLVDAAGRKIAKPTAKASRYSDVHMAQFKKMDSIANHPSSFRARPGFARPTGQSLKRSSSKAGLNEPERPRTAGKSPSTRIPPPVTGRPTSISPFKTIRPSSSHEADAPAKRPRRDGDQDISSSRPTTLPQPVSSRLLSPTKASIARAGDHSSTPNKPSTLPRSNSVRSIRSVPRSSTTTPMSLSKPPQAQLNKPLPAVPTELVSTSPVKQSLTRSASMKSLAAPVAPEEASSSKIPAFSNLKSILRSPKKSSQLQSNTPKQSSTIPVPASSQKKVDFTPAVKSRYATKLAESSPSPAKIDRSSRPARDSWQPAIPYDSSAFVVNDPDSEVTWSDDQDDTCGVSITYPSLPTLSPRPQSRAGPGPGSTTGPVDHTIGAFTRKAREHGRRESKEFKSIFTTLHPKPSTSSLTSVNTQVNRTNPVDNASRAASAAPAFSTSPRKSEASPSTIRRVRASAPLTTAPILPFTDIPNANVSSIPHGIPGKKRRHDADIANDRFGQDDDAKENRHVTQNPSLPGAWEDSTLEKDGLTQDEDEGDKRGGKRARFTAPSPAARQERREREKSPIKRRQADARELAAKTAKERKKTMGGISLSRLNALASPKKRG